ncbi:hypothetical protein BYT27DRAFT_7208708 [Phlegmacium glaucopus]|nr:hypothetical protein BYT27DRAFT_7208708 [Phlegmacium glaucopus]
MVRSQGVARVCNAIARGDPSQKKIAVPVQGVMVQLKDVINTMMEKLGQFAKDITRVSQEVGTEGKLGGQALVLDVEGTWRELTAVFSKLAANSTPQVRNLLVLHLYSPLTVLLLTRLRALAAEVTRVTLKLGSQGRLGGQAHVPDVEGVWLNLARNIKYSQLKLLRPPSLGARGDLTQKIETPVKGEMSTLKGIVNSMVDQLSAFASEMTRVALAVGTRDILGGQARVEGVQGTWADLTRNVNVVFVNVDVQEEIIDLKTTVNSMAAQLGTLANKVTQVSLEVRREGILGGQAVLPNAQGMWKVITDNVNLMAMNLTNQVRLIAEVTKAVAGGDLTKTMSMETSWN